MQQPVTEAGVDLLKEMGLSITSVVEMERGRMAELKMQQPLAEAGDVHSADTPANRLQEYAHEYAMLDIMQERLEARLRQQEGYKIYT
jgi:hypothetical protein